MRKVSALLVAVVMLVFEGAILSGCEEKGRTGSDRVMAGQIEDDATKYSEFQYNCPVCKGEPISGEYHAEVDGKRIYFDKRECEEKFKENPEEYLSGFQTYGAQQKQKKQ